MYILKRTVDTAPSDKWHPSPKLSAFSRTISEPILYSIAVPKRCTFRRVTPAHHLNHTQQTNNTGTLPLATSVSCRSELAKILDAFNVHESFLPIEKCDFHLPSPHTPEESVFLNVVRPKCKEGSLRDVLHCVKDVLGDESNPNKKWDPKNARPLDEVDIREYARQILLGLVELRSHGIVSDRLSCDNVMIDHEGRAVMSGIERKSLTYS